MKKFKILHSHGLHIRNATTSNKPFDETEFEDDDTLTVAIIRDPYEHFYTLFTQYFHTEMSPRLKKDIQKSLKTLNEEEFWVWFSNLNYLPLFNPQTFQLDMKKRLDVAIDNLKCFHYVIPYENIDMFIEKIAPETSIIKPQKTNLPFAVSLHKESSQIQNFIDKDSILYQEALRLWDKCEVSQFQPLHPLTKKRQFPTKINIHNYEGIVDNIKINMITGWAYNKETYATLNIGIFQNKILIKTVKADIMKPDIMNFINHPTGACGFEAIFDKDMFYSTDTIEIKIVPENISLNMGKYALAFFES